MTLEEWKRRFEKWNLLHYQNDDASHDIYHFRRVAKNAFTIASHYPPGFLDGYVLLAAAYFHDVVNLSKDHPNRKKASSYSAEKAAFILRDLGFYQEKIPLVCHAILTHSYSANITPTTLEASVLQDADRLDGFGAVGVLRALYVSGRLNRSLFHLSDPLAESRPLDDQNYSLDHFKTKILVMPKTLKTSVGKELALPRIQVVEQFRNDISTEILLGVRDALTEVAKAFFIAGQKGNLLFHPEDPFAIERKKKEHLYALDGILGFSGLSWLFASLREELSLDVFDQFAGEQKQL